MENNELLDTIELVDRDPRETGFGRAVTAEVKPTYDPSQALHSELHGAQVLISPDLENDPAKQQGKAGVIAYARTYDEIYVNFTNGKEGIYSLEDVMQLKDRSEIFPEDKAALASISLKDYKDLFTIAELMDKGKSTDLMKALEIAGANPGVREAALTPLNEIYA